MMSSEENGHEGTTERCIIVKFLPWRTTYVPEWIILCRHCVDDKSIAKSFINYINRERHVVLAPFKSP